MANHSGADIVTHFHFLIEFIFKLETWSFSVSFLTSVFCMMPSDMCLLSDFKASWLNKNQGLTSQWSQTLRKRQSETDRRTAKQLQRGESLWRYVKYDQ